MRKFGIQKLVYSIFLVSTFFLFNAASCERTEEELCNGSTATQKEAKFDVKVRIEYKDFVPYEGPVRLRIFKNYCEGEKSGDYTKLGQTDVDGLWDPHYNYFYKYANLYDKVTVEWYVTDSDGEHLAYSKEFDYNAASSEMWIINHVIDVRLRWDSTH